MSTEQLASADVRLTDGERDGLSILFEGNRFTALCSAVEAIVAAHVAAARADECARALTEAADALAAQAPKTRADYVRVLRLYAAESWRLAQPEATS